MKWSAAEAGPNYLLSGSVKTLRARSRDAVRQMGQAPPCLSWRPDVLVSNIPSGQGSSHSSRHLGPGIQSPTGGCLPGMDG